MSFVSVNNSERDTIKNCALFLPACATAEISKKSEREDWLRENVTIMDAIHVLSCPQSLFSISLSNACYDTWAVLSGLEITAHCISLGFYRCKRKLKLDNEKQ